MGVKIRNRSLMLNNHFPNMKIYFRRVQHCHLNGRVQHNAAAQLTPPPPHTAYEQLATMVRKMPRNNLITQNSQNISPPPHSSPNPSIPQYISPGSTATNLIQNPTNFRKAQAAETLREMEGVVFSRPSLISNISILIILAEKKIRITVI